MEHHGLLLERMIREKGYSIAVFARKMKVNRWSVYTWLNQPILNVKTINLVKKVLNSECLGNVPKSRNFSKTNHLDATDDSSFAKYQELLEKHNQLLRSA
jgi:hypothetical protein